LLDTNDIDSEKCAINKKRQIPFYIQQQQLSKSGEMREAEVVDMERVRKKNACFFFSGYV
jgi:hypothetical protein